jgi:hypothetical protein
MVGAEVKRSGKDTRHGNRNNVGWIGHGTSLMGPTCAVLESPKRFVGAVRTNDGPNHQNSHDEPRVMNAIWIHSWSVMEVHASSTATTMNMQI